MKILIQGAQIIDPQSPFHKKKKNILLQNGKISAISDRKLASDRVIEADGMLLSTGWVDMGTFVGDPGLEQKEDLASLINTAAAGGFTEVCVLPNTQPIIQTKNEISYLTKDNDHSLVTVHPIAAVSRNCAGEELTEMIDLNQSGAIAFTDGLKTIWHTDLMLKALQYLQKFDGLLINHPEDVWLNMFGQMHEGVQSTMLGLKGMPRIAEEIAIRRDLELLKYAGGRLHFSRLSSSKSLAMIRAAKKKLNVTCDVTAYQFLLTDEKLKGFNTNFKVSPPLREKSDVDGMIKALKDDTIDVICSGHLPQDEESKNIEFDHAEFGIISLQTIGYNLVALSTEVPLPILIQKITDAPRKLLGLELPRIDVEEKANLTLLDPNKEWILDAASSHSKAKNSPWWGAKLKGKVKAVFNNNKHWIDK